MDMMDRHDDPALARPLPRGERLLRMVRRPVAFALVGIALVGLLALLYLNEVAGVTKANDELRDLQATQTHLERQDASLRATLGSVSSPAYADQRARQLGLRPAASGSVVVITTNEGQP